jgi:hypothetical protein
LSEPPKIVHPQDSPVEQVFSKEGHLVLPQKQRAGLDHIDPGVIEQRRVGQPDDAPLRVGFHGGDLLEPEREIQVAVREIGPPIRAAVREIGRAVAPDADEGEHIPLEAGLVGPDRGAGAV